jgi:hypothetical protein
MAEIARAVPRVKKDKLFSPLCFVSSILKTKQKIAVRCIRPHRPPALKKSDSKNNPCEHDLR